MVKKITEKIVKMFTIFVGKNNTDRNVTQQRWLNLYVLWFLGEGRGVRRRKGEPLSAVSFRVRTYL